MLKNYLVPQQWGAALILAMSCALISSFSYSANTQQALTLQTAIERTLQQNPQLHQFEFASQRLASERETSDLKPAYQLGVELENFAGTGEVSSFDSAELTVALSSVIELGDKRQSRVALANARMNTLELERQAQTLDVLGELTGSFIQLMSTQQELKLAAEAVELSKSLHNTVKNRAHSGAISDAEVMRAKAMLTQSNIQQENLRRRLERQKIALARFWGSTKIEFSSVEGDLFAFGQSQAFSDLYTAVQQSPAIMVFASEQRLKDAEVRLAQTQNRADLGWQFGIRRFEETGDSALTLGFSMPLFNESRNSGTVKSALAERNALEYRRSDRLLALHSRLYSAYSQLEQFIAAHQQLKQSVIPDLEKALTITRQAYDRGRLKYQDWITAQQELLNAKQQMIETATVALLNQAVIEQLTAQPLTE